MDICNKNLAYSQMQEEKKSINPEIAWKGGGFWACPNSLEHLFIEGDKKYKGYYN